jgi:hypothetical protein
MGQVVWGTRSDKKERDFDFSLLELTILSPTGKDPHTPSIDTKHLDVMEVGKSWI